MHEPLKRIVIGFYRLFYHQVHVEGLENLPRGQALILAPNHQNALMDALAVVFNTRRPVVFLARADIFRNPRLASVLTFMRIMPVFRLRDGKDTLALNERIFEKSIEVLEKKEYPLAIFPEATHIDKHHLRVLQKGLSRIAFQAEERNHWQLGLKVVPVGLHLWHYTNARTVVHVRFGKPVEVADFRDAYLENPQRGMLAFRDRLSDGISGLMLNIRDLKHYAADDFLRQFYRLPLLGRMGLDDSYPNRLLADQRSAEGLHRLRKADPEAYAQLEEKALRLDKELKAKDIRPWVPHRPSSRPALAGRALGLLLLLPFFLYGAAISFLPHFLLERFTQRKIADTQFRSSIKFALGGVFLFPILFATLFGLSFLWFGPWWLNLLFGLSLPASGIFALHYHRWWRKLGARWRWQSDADLRRRAGGIAQEIKSQMDPIVSDTKI